MATSFATSTPPERPIGSPPGLATTPSFTPFELAGETVGIIGHAVGAPFAVLVAEELFACGCSFLLSLTSAGQIEALAPPPYFVVIDRALRELGHRLPLCPALRIRRGRTRSSSPSR